MKGFAGFPEGPQRVVPLPVLLFSELLPDIDHLGELKLTLYVFWALTQREGEPRFLRRCELEGDETLLATLKEPEGSPRQALAEALDRALARGTLLAVTAGEGEPVYFLNTARGRAAAQGLERGDWRLPEEARPLPSYRLARPNVYRLYEQNIGPLTPLAAELLRDAEATYPEAWIREAIGLAVENNARSWRYVAAILERWQAQGRAREEEASQKGVRRYVEGELADFIDH